MTIDELETRLNDEFSDIYKCILINGSWGIGKTHFFMKNYLKNKKYVYISWIKFYRRIKNRNLFSIE